MQIFKQMVKKGFIHIINARFYLKITISVVCELRALKRQYQYYRVYAKLSHMMLFMNINERSIVLLLNCFTISHSVYF